jgi:hypothetical protein
LKKNPHSSVPNGSSFGNLSLFNHALDCSSSVSEELGIDSLERSVSLSRLLYDSISVSLEVLIVIGMVGFLCHFAI